MKYGESIFDIAYLLFAIISGCLILHRAKDETEKMMGCAALILGIGDAFHLLPRVLAYFVPEDLSFYLGMGKLVTSITVTIFYVLLYYIWMHKYEKGQARGIFTIWLLAGVRIILCLLPQNGWTSNEGNLTWGILRNIPFIILGFIICRLFYQVRNEDGSFRHIWLYILFSFLFYLPVTVGTGVMPALGMLMLPKTVCYILMIRSFLLAQRPDT